MVDLLDYDVRFGQGFLFSPPRPVRAEVLQGLAERQSERPAAPPVRTAERPAPLKAEPHAEDEPPAPLRRDTALAQLARGIVRRAQGVEGCIPACAGTSEDANRVRFRSRFSMTVPILTDHFSALAPNYDAVLSDVWGVVHNGVAATPPACEALTRFREQGGTVVLISNAPRPGAQVRKFLDHLKVPRSAYDAIVTSGDVTRDVVAKRAGQKFYPDRPGARSHDLHRPRHAPFSTPEEADYVVCTGLFNDEVETPGRLSRALEAIARAQPVHAVRQSRRGGRARRQAGLLRRRARGRLRGAGRRGLLRRQAATGRSTISRSPRPRMRARRARCRATLALNRVLAIGDSVRTDLKGANDLGVDCLFVTAGIHAEELGNRDDPDLARSARCSPPRGRRRRR